MSEAIAWQKQPMGKVTQFFLVLCCSLLFLSNYLVQKQSNQPAPPALALFSSPVEQTLLFDYPEFYQLVSRFIGLYGYENLEANTETQPEAEALINQIKHTPYWQGIYTLLLKENIANVKKEIATTPLFEKIREGQVWRLFSPCVLHADLLHLLFNMLWLIVIGKQIEQRLLPFRYTLFILLTGIISNTFQYLMGGPNFVGFSGVLCAMLAFIWVRQKQAPWEGYLLDSSTISFMLIFVLGMAFLQLLSFFSEKSFEIAFSPNIANAAHLMGGVCGYFFGKWNFFSWRRL